MNNISKLLLGVAAFGLMSCSNDEPAPAPTPEGEGTVMYLNVNIRSANGGSRAEGDYANGHETAESDITNAWFLFYNADGEFQYRSNGFVDGAGNDMPNVEYMGANTLVLRNVKENDKPRYMVTILNAPQAVVDKVQNETLSLEQTSQLLLDLRSGDEGYFVMTTASFFADATTEKFDKTYYYANVLDPDDFMKEPKDVIAAGDPVITVYVERLAAKFTIEGLNEDGVYKVPVTIAGLDNDNNGDVTDATELYVKILGFGLTGQEAASYFSKNITGFDTKAPWEDAAAEPWNNPAYNRSFWAKSPSYGTDLDLNYIGFDAAQNDVTKPIYGHETTNTLDKLQAEDGKLIQSKVTNVVFAAQVFGDAACTKPVNFVQYGNRYFTQDYFKAFVLARLNATGSLNYFVRTSHVETSTEDGGTKTEDTYAQVSADNFNFVKKNDGKTATVQLVCNLAAGTDLYKCLGDLSDNSATNWQKIEEDAEGKTAVEQLDKVVAGFVGDTKLTGSTDGATFYSVPVEHLLGKDLKKDYAINNEGEYGVVRNHWYQIKIGKVFRLGAAVFEPGTGAGGTETKPEILIPEDPNDDTYAIAAQINILSWKIVEQNVDL